MKAPAKLPLELTRENPRHISDLLPAESAFTKFTALRVAENGDCFLTPDAELASIGDFMSMEVHREQSGLFHVTVHDSIKYDLGERPPREGDLPVTSIAIRPGVLKLSKSGG